MNGARAARAPHMTTTSASPLLPVPPWDGRGPADGDVHEVHEEAL
ncbi:hypothetical protein [Streptomyces taklimakanensis]|nr:hypothetical protein [Streptomyces taklimakanensis]